MAEFTVFIDGACPFCAREAQLWRRLDRERGRLTLVDISAPDFEPKTVDRTHEQLMAEIHGQDASGQLYTGVEVFRRAYKAVGWGWVLAPTAWPILRNISDLGYRWFAKYRLRLTGRRCDSTCRIPNEARS